MIILLMTGGLSIATVAASAAIGCILSGFLFLGLLQIIIMSCILAKGKDKLKHKKLWYFLVMFLPQLIILCLNFPGFIPGFIIYSTFAWMIIDEFFEK